MLSYQSPATFPVLSGSGDKLEPNDHLLCFDDLYYTGVVEPAPATDVSNVFNLSNSETTLIVEYNKFFRDYSPMWSEVGVHMHWKQTLVDLANQYLRRHFGIQNEDPIPPVRVPLFEFAYTTDLRTLT